MWISTVIKTSFHSSQKLSELVQHELVLYDFFSGISCWNRIAWTYHTASSRGITVFIFTGEGGYYERTGNYLSSENVNYLPVPSIWTPHHTLMSTAPCISSPGIFQVSSQHYKTRDHRYNIHCHFHNCHVRSLIFVFTSCCVTWGTEAIAAALCFQNIGLLHCIDR